MNHWTTNTVSVSVYCIFNVCSISTERCRHSGFLTLKRSLKLIFSGYEIYATHISMFIIQIHTHTHTHTHTHHRGISSVWKETHYKLLFSDVTFDRLLDHSGHLLFTGDVTEVFCDICDKIFNTKLRKRTNREREKQINGFRALKTGNLFDPVEPSPPLCERPCSDFFTWSRKSDAHRNANFTSQWEYERHHFPNAIWAHWKHLWSSFLART